MSTFESLTLALERHFAKALADLPEALRQRVEKEFFPMPWDNINPDGRRSIALQLDYQHDPATESDRQFWWDFFERMHEVEAQIKEWESADSPTATDKVMKETRLNDLRLEHERMKVQQRQARGDYFPGHKENAKFSTPLPAEDEFIAYPKAMTLLVERLNATPEELATWIFLGPDTGGLAAYLNANELNPPPRFHFDVFMGEDYLSPLMACWFQRSDIECFTPEDRYIPGGELIDRWGKLRGIRAEAFIRAKIAESRLLDLHPTFGGTCGTFSEEAGFPHLSAGMFALSNIEAIESEDFGNEAAPQAENNSSPCKPVEASLIRMHFRVVQDEDANERWWKDKMGDAKRYHLLECRVGEGMKGRGRGSLWLPAMIAGWLIDRHKNGKEGLTISAAAQALKRFSGCEEIAEHWFPTEE